MKKSDLRILEGQLSELPHIQQKHILNLLTQPLNSQTSSFIDCLTEVTTCCHCDGQKVKKWGGDQQAFSVTNAQATTAAKPLMHSQEQPFQAYAIKKSGLIIYYACLTACHLEKRRKESMLT